MGFSFLPNGSNDHKNFEAHLLDYYGKGNFPHKGIFSGKSVEENDENRKKIRQTGPQKSVSSLVILIVPADVPGLNLLVSKRVIHIYFRFQIIIISRATVSSALNNFVRRYIEMIRK